MNEEKTIDEAVEEQADEMKEFEPVAFDEVIKETEPERKDAPVLRALGDPDPADMNMIHKHLDNFLAMLCGETPIDDNVRTSTEYWLKRLAEGLGGSTKKTYCHYISITRESSGRGFKGLAFIFNNDKNDITTDSFTNMLKTEGVYVPIVNGYMYTISGGVKTVDRQWYGLGYYSETQYNGLYVEQTDLTSFLVGTYDFVTAPFVIVNYASYPIN